MFSDKIKKIAFELMTNAKMFELFLIVIKIAISCNPYF